MSRKPVSGNSPVDIPKNVAVDPKGYVYLNRGYSIRTSKDGSHTYVDHSRILIGKVVETSMGNWRSERKMYPNARYMKMLEDEKRPVKIFLKQISHPVQFEQEDMII